MADAITPSGCAYCGLTAREHACRWAAPVGWHTYIAPGQLLILARMRTRRSRASAGGHRG